jgi:Ubiquitin family
MSTMSLSSSTSGRFIIRTLDGQNQVYDDMPTDATVRDLKQRIFVAEGIPVENQKLIYGPEIMNGQCSVKSEVHHCMLNPPTDSRTLESYNIREVPLDSHPPSPNPQPRPRPFSN